MLRVAPPHFRPDANYLGNYNAQVGRAARQRVAEALAEKFNLRVVDDWPMPALGVDCVVMEAPRDAVMEKLVEDVALDARVDWVQSMNLFHVLSYNDPLYALQPTATLWHLADIHRVATGKDVRVAQIDSAVELDHPDLRGRIAVARNFVDGRDSVVETQERPSPESSCPCRRRRGHRRVRRRRVDGASSLLATSAEGSLAICSSFTLAKALQFALERKVAVVNLSLGGPRDRLLERLLDVAISRGVVIVAAANSASKDGGFPASVSGVLAVAADDVHDLPRAILRAPGQDIPTTLPGQRWGLVSGSSFAAAEMTGLVALLLELAPDQKPQQIRETLTASETTLASRQNRTIVDACAAIAKTLGACACGCSMAGGGHSPPGP
jgi:hypothetical protein